MSTPSRQTAAVLGGDRPGVALRFTGRRRPSLAQHLATLASLHPVLSRRYVALSEAHERRALVLDDDRTTAKSGYVARLRELRTAERQFLFALLDVVQEGRR